MGEFDKGMEVVDRMLAQTEEKYGSKNRNKMFTMSLKLFGKSGLGFKDLAGVKKRIAMYLERTGNAPQSKFMKKMGKCAAGTNRVCVEPESEQKTSEVVDNVTKSMQPKRVKPEFRYLNLLAKGGILIETTNGSGIPKINGAMFYKDGSVGVYERGTRTAHDMPANLSITRFLKCVKIDEAFCKQIYIVKEQAQRDFDKDREKLRMYLTIVDKVALQLENVKDKNIFSRVSEMVLGRNAGWWSKKSKSANELKTVMTKAVHYIRNSSSGFHVSGRTDR